MEPNGIIATPAPQTLDNWACGLGPPCNPTKDSWLQLTVRSAWMEYRVPKIVGIAAFLERHKDWCGICELIEPQKALACNLLYPVCFQPIF